MLKWIIIFLSGVFAISSHANIVGTDTQNFNPTTSGLDFVTVHSSQTLEPGIVNVGLFLNYAVNSLPYLGSGTNPQGRTEFNDSLLSSDLSFGLGVGDRWDVGISFPVVVAQEYDEASSFGNFKTTGNTEVRLNTKYRFYKSANWGFATIASMNFNRIKNNPFVGEEAGPTFNIELAADTERMGIVWGLNVGHRWRDKGKALAGSGIEPMPDQLIASVGMSKRVDAVDTKFIAEVLSSYPTGESSNISDRSLSSLELLAGLKHDWSSEIALHAGGGTELNSGTATPDWRVYLGVNWSTGPMFERRPWEERLEFNKETRTEVKTLVLSDLRFKFNSTEIATPSESTYHELVKELNQLPASAKIVVEGHTDSIGSAEYNLKLSSQRAQTVADRLNRDLSRPDGDITAKGYGETRPVASNRNYQGRNRNRRVEIKVIKKVKVFE